MPTVLELQGLRPGVLVPVAEDGSGSVQSFHAGAFGNEGAIGAGGPGQGLTGAGGLNGAARGMDRASSLLHSSWAGAVSRDGSQIRAEILV